ncbi:MAG: MCE family protein [Sphingobacteriales bacterium]|nr:MCE family protein [Sphingobacteriales bacterium]
MTRQFVSNSKLGVFVIAGMLFLILLLYMIGKNENMFGNTFRLRAQFGNVQGLTAGNNVRYAGIQVGTVKKVNILNDTLIEVVMLIETKMKQYIRKNAVVSIGTDGLMGNRVLNISPSVKPAPLVETNDILPVKKTAEMDEMLQTLARTNEDVAVIATQLKNTVNRINNSAAVWDILNDKSLPQHFRASLLNVRSATAKTVRLVSDLQLLVSNVKEGKGSLGAIISDSALALGLQEAISRISRVGEDADSLAQVISTLAGNIQYDIENGRGPARAILKDSVLAENLQLSIQNLQKGTEGFNAIMEALKHNFLFRGYFRKLEKQKEKDKQPARGQ